MSVEDRTLLVDEATASRRYSHAGRFGAVLRAVLRVFGMVVALVATVLLAVAVVIVGPNVEEWRGVLPTLDRLGYPDSNDVRAADALGWATKQDKGRRRSGEQSGRSGPSYRFLAPSRGAAPEPGHWCATNEIGYRVDLTGARLAGMDSETELLRWRAAFALWEEASNGKYEFEYRGAAKFPLVMNSSLEDMKINDHRLKRDEIAITYATSRSTGDPNWTDYLHAGLGSSLGIGGIGPVIWGPGESRSGLITSGSIILDAHDVSDPDDLLPTVYVHEVGHALGLGHVKNPNQMMYENAPASAQISKGDRRGIRKLASAGCP